MGQHMKQSNSNREHIHQHLIDERIIKSKAERGEPCGFQGLHTQPAVHLLQREVREVGGRLLATSGLLVTLAGCFC